MAATADGHHASSAAVQGISNAKRKMGKRTYLSYGRASGPPTQMQPEPVIMQAAG